MGYPLRNMEERIEQLFDVDRPRYRRLWRYYRNPMVVCAGGESDNGSERPYRQAQEWGLPSRITGLRTGSDLERPQPVGGVGRKEVVIENDIAWRIETMVDYLFGKELVIESAAADPQRRKAITGVLNAVLSHNGGIVLLQQLALLGAVYGFVDVLVKMNEPTPDGGAPSDFTPGTEPAPGNDPSANPAASNPSQDGPPPERLGRLIRLEVVEPARALPVLSGRDYRVVEQYAQCYTVLREDGQGRPGAARRNWIERIFGLSLGRRKPAWGENQKLVVEIIDGRQWQRFEDEALVGQGPNSLGEIPLAHIQNTAMPFEYSGASDVESLIPLQDELNTRLSDRASRIALQSFKMYLGVGVEGFTDMPVGPGRMWATDNAEAKVIEFGGDSSCPSENNHIADLREAMDKASAVTPVAAGAIKNRIGRLTSAAALRVTLLALLSKTEKKRTTYGAGIARMCELSLAWLDAAGLFATTEEERRVELHWPSPLPQNDMEKLQEAAAKVSLGVPRETVLRELGYGGEMTNDQTRMTNQ